MRPTFVLAFAPTVFCGAAAALAAETPKQARLTIDGEAYNVPLAKPFAVRIGGERVTLQIDPLDDLEFDEAGVAFRYPTELIREANNDDDSVTIWTLQGQNAAVMLQRYDGGLDPKSLLGVLVDNIAQRDGVPEDKRQAVKLRGAERAYPGTQLRSSSGEGEARRDLVQNVFTFANDAGVFALIIQDARPAGAKDSSEYAETLRLLGDSLKTGPEPPAPSGTE